MKRQTKRVKSLPSGSHKVCHLPKPSILILCRKRCPDGIPFRLTSCSLVEQERRIIQGHQLGLLALHKLLVWLVVGGFVERLGNGSSIPLESNVDIT